MASLKEVKGRIATVTNTRKITSAMKMVASSKLYKAQEAITHMLPYEQHLHNLLDHLLGNGEVLVWNTPREVKRVALVVFSSNNSLCGAFNANVIKQALTWLEEHKGLGEENVLIYAIGKKVSDALLRRGYTLQGNFEGMANRPSFSDASTLAQTLMDMFVSGKVDHVAFIYNHYKSMSSQVLKREVYLPMQTSGNTMDGIKETDYILEPSRKELLALLLPKVLRLKLYTVLLDSNASEHASRAMAMQIATDNADDLLQKLTLMYNKTRQQAITSELLDIVGGSMF
ncbi:MAG: F0F1 ATP synthase subunit gamma [Bacteroidaceae bacterium]|nr:F0F1 ATP synthase subunit gamma [Bacteroidaceae bacterium]